MFTLLLPKRFQLHFQGISINFVTAPPSYFHHYHPQQPTRSYVCWNSQFLSAFGQSRKAYLLGTEDIKMFRILFRSFCACQSPTFVSLKEDRVKSCSSQHKICYYFMTGFRFQSRRKKSGRPKAEGMAKLVWELLLVDRSSFAPIIIIMNTKSYATTSVTFITFSSRAVWKVIITVLRAVDVAG